MRENTEDRKRQIIAATLEVISEEGMQGLTMKKIAGKVGVTDAALYRHFESKHALMEAVIQTIGHKLIANINMAVMDIKDPMEKLKQILRLHLTYLESNRGIPRLLFSETIHHNDPVLRQALLNMVNHYLDLVRGVLLRAKESEQIKTDIDIDAAAMAFLGLVQSNALIWSLSGFGFSISGRADALWRVFSEGVG